MSLLPWQQALDRRHVPSGEVPLFEPVREPAVPTTGGYWVCGECAQRVTPVAAAIAMGGSHEHGFLNPAGFSFHIGCFEQAPGCREFGAQTPADSWFPGYRWRYALCVGCGEHLGWSYYGPTRFFGLILARLRRVSDAADGP